MCSLQGSIHAQAHGHGAGWDWLNVKPWSSEDETGLGKLLNVGMLWGTGLSPKLLGCLGSGPTVIYVVPRFSLESLKRIVMLFLPMSSFFFFNSEENVNMNSLHLASLSTSTQKNNMAQNSDEDAPLDISDLAVTNPTNRYFMNTVSILLHNVLDWF